MVQERLGDPGDGRGQAGADRFREADQGQQSEGIGAPHRAYAIGDLDGQPRVEAGDHVVTRTSCASTFSIICMAIAMTFSGSAVITGP